MSNQIRVLVVDDHESFRRAMRDLIETTREFVLVGESASGEAALEAVDELSPHMVVIDKRMPGMGGVEAARQITASRSGIVVLLVSVEVPNPQLTESSGAAHFARKHEVSAELLRKVWETHGS